uniref:E3 ubiquitin-protein ligase ZFP91 n=1 Tax=Periophthalmus magnuspinnatus TaxID=409849 RepID=A0A3B4B0M3_9GOBI
SAEDKATEQTSDQGKSTTPRRGLRQRGVGRPRPGVSAPASDVNGASLSPQSSGRVLRDRSTRSVPAWLKEAKSEDENEEELNTDAAALKRRKVSNGKRKKLSECAGSQDAGSGITGSAEEEGDSSEEDVPFRDDLNDQSYDPKGEEGPKPKRRLPPRQKEKREKETDKHPKAEKEIKKEGTDLESLESAEEEVKAEEKHVEETGGPRKRGRRKKDDKTPRLPKRKKPPVQYVRCEMEGCGTVLAHPRYLQHHIKYQHLLKKKYVCPHPSCGRLFRLQKQLLRHAKHHTQRDYICEYCARAFKSSHNLAVHRMIHTGEKPLCEICGFTCRQKASLNWHMKKHDADATYQFSCSICGKKFEKKDCVVAHKAKSHPEVLIAEALAANAGALITTPASLLELQGIPVPTDLGSLEVGQIVPESQAPAVTQVENMTQQVGHQVVLLGQDQTLHTMQVPVTIALSPIDPPSPADQTHLQLQMPVQFVQGPQPLTPSPSAVVTHQPPLQAYSSQQQSTGQPHILQMTFQPVSQLHLQTSSPALVSSPQSQ